MRSIAVALAVVLGCSVNSAALAHDDSCHTGRTCPADNHEYVWSAISCASATGDRRPEDQTPVDFGGVRYWCHAVVDQGMVPPSSGRPGLTLPGPTTTIPSVVPATQPALSSGGPDTARIAACGGDRITALAVSVPFAPATTITSSRFASLGRPALIAAGTGGVARSWYRISGSLLSMTATPSGLAVALRSTDGRSIAAHIPTATCWATGTSGLGARAARALAKVRKACGAPTLKGTVLLDGKGSLTGLAVWRDSPTGRYAELDAVVAFSASKCTRRV